MKIVIVGLPGSGKGTQAELLSREFGIKKITTSDLLREIAKENTERGQRVKQCLDRGEIVPDEITNQAIKENLQNLDDYLLDGYPRDLIQANFLHDFKPPDIAIYLDVPVDEIVKRLSSRRICPKCGAVYNLISNPPKTDEICDVCGVKLVQREDDTPELVKKRIEVQSEELDKILNFYRKENKLLTIDANKSIQEVFETIKKHLEGVKMERTFVMIKPDGVQRRLIGEIIKRYEQAGLRVVAMKMIKLDEAKAKEHYPDSMGESIAKKAKEKIGDLGKTPEEYGKMVLAGLRKYVTSAPVVCMVLEGDDAIKKVREITGYTDPSRAKPGTIRGDLGEDSYEKANAEGRAVRNLVHASDSPEAAKQEIERFFKHEEIFS